MNLRRYATALCVLLLLTGAVRSGAQSGGRPDGVAGLSERFWAWRAVEQPFSSDDIPRLDRPAGFVVDWRPETVAKRERELGEFEKQWAALKPGADGAVHDAVDYRLLGSAIARVRWELTVTADWQRDPMFYVYQSVGSYYDLLLQPAPFGAERQREIVARVREMPGVLKAARVNLTDVRQPFAKLTVEGLDKIAERMQKSEAELRPELTAETRKELEAAMPAAVEALTEYRAWLTKGLEADRKDTAIGREKYVFFLRNVALMPYTPEQLLTMSRLEWSRALAFEAYQQNRLDGTAAPLFASADAQIAAEAKAEEGVRRFLGENKILTVPADMKHYRNLLLPGYLAPIEDLGVTDDLTGPSRLGEDGTSYIRKPSGDLGFFYLSTARDPRPILVHEGVPGHYFQLGLALRNADPIRRHYYDSGANEGIGFYAEEMMLQSGYFDDNPQTKATIYSFMRLRALRVEVDVKLALGEYTLEQAAKYLEETVPMDHATALDEASFFASGPGQAISYQIGKLQINGLLADARRRQGAGFSLLKFNDGLWSNGNVPISLQRWELLGDASEVPAAVAVPQTQH